MEPTPDVEERTVDVPGPRPCRVVLHDDRELVRHGVRAILDPAGDVEVVDEADVFKGAPGGVAETVDRLLATDPDVVMLRVRLGDEQGLEVCRRVRAARPDVAILVLTADDDATLFATIEAGATGCVLDEISAPALVQAIRRLAAGQAVLDPAVTTRVLDRLRHGSRPQGGLRSLGARERRILDLIGAGLTNREIARELEVSEGKVRHSVSTLLAKLGVASRAEAAARTRSGPGARP